MDVKDHVVLMAWLSTPAKVILDQRGINKRGGHYVELKNVGEVDEVSAVAELKCNAVDEEVEEKWAMMGVLCGTLKMTTMGREQ